MNPTLYTIGHGRRPLPACHRSLLAEKLAAETGLEVEHVVAD